MVCWGDRVVDLCMSISDITKCWYLVCSLLLILNLVFCGLSLPGCLTVFITISAWRFFVWHEDTPQSLGLAMMTDEYCLMLFGSFCCHIMSPIYILSVFMSISCLKSALISRLVFSDKLSLAFHLGM